MSKKLKAAGANVVLEELVEEKRGAIFIPGTADKPRLMRCKVLAMGPGELRVTDAGKQVRLTVSDIVGQTVEVGTEVLLLKFTHEGQIDGKDVRIAKAEEIKAVVG